MRTSLYKLIWKDQGGQRFSIRAVMTWSEVEDLMSWFSANSFYYDLAFYDRYHWRTVG